MKQMPLPLIPNFVAKREEISFRATLSRKSSNCPVIPRSVAWAFGPPIRLKVRLPVMLSAAKHLLLLQPQEQILRRVTLGMRCDSEFGSPRTMWYSNSRRSTAEADRLTKIYL
jgi:hypothetical protein